MASEDSQKKAEWHDWVGDLFEPAFGGTIEDLLRSQDEEKQQKPSIKHVSVHDPEAVKRVYEKVRIMSVLDEEMRKQRAEKQQKARQAKQLEADRQEPVPPRYILKELASEDNPEGQKIDPNDSCIWDSGEISVLRKAFKSVKQQNIDTMVKMRVIDARNNELETVASNQQTIIKAQKEKLIETKNANRRLKLNVDSLKEEVSFLSAKVGAMEDVFGELTREKSDMVQELHDNRVEMDKERMKRERIQLKLDTLKQEALAEKMSVEDNIKTMCRKTILDLQKMVKQLEKELFEERDKRKATEKGLQHLRTHFSSLPLQHILPQNVVTKDELSRVQF